MNFAQKEQTAVEEPVKPEVAIDTVKTSPQSDEIRTVDFKNTETMAYTKPISISFDERELEKPSSWTDVYVSTVAVLHKNNPSLFNSLKALPGKTGLEFGKAKDAEIMISPKIISDELCVETNFSATDFVRRIKILLLMCDTAYDRLKITYEIKQKSVYIKQDIPTESSECEIRTDADVKLSEKYPVLFKRIYFCLKEYGNISVSARTFIVK